MKIQYYVLDNEKPAIIQGSQEWSAYIYDSLNDAIEYANDFFFPYHEFDKENWQNIVDYS